ncbi:MAG TPA: hypothetical protein VM253_04690 [Candidatus Limnocylindrales bacterium]|jgi:hypothetical protein|nr:hypothetical protein [Candidatus Limnocylindrales bacterium]
MGQVNVNSGGTEPAGEPTGSAGAGMILGIIIAIIVIAALVYFLVLGGGNGGGGAAPDGANGDGVDLPDDGGNGDDPGSSWRLVDLA